MLKQLQKALGMQAEKLPDAKTPNESLEIQVDTTEVQAAIQAAVDEVRAEFEDFKQTAETLHAHDEATIAELTKQLEDTNAALNALQAEKDAAVKEALAAKMEARKEKIVATLGTERADALLKATEGMDDAAFEAVASALGVSAEVESQSPLFKETGVDATVDAAKIVETAEMKILREKFGNTAKQ
jgi:hypothetical protein